MSFKKMDTEADRQFWASLEANAKEFAEWPEWKRRVSIAEPTLRESKK